MASVSTGSMVAIAQLVEHRIVIPVVAGSSPVGHPIKVSKTRGSMNHGFFCFYVLNQEVMRGPIEASVRYT